jgi:hypothetical protein
VVDEFPGAGDDLSVSLNSGHKKKICKNSSSKSLHDLGVIPNYAISVEVCRGVEPEVVSLLAPSYATREQIGLQNVRAAARVTQKLKVDLVMSVAPRRKLQLSKEVWSVQASSEYTCPKNSVPREVEVVGVFARDIQQ